MLFLIFLDWRYRDKFCVIVGSSLCMVAADWASGVGLTNEQLFFSIAVAATMAATITPINEG